MEIKMAIEGVVQPEIIEIDKELRLRKFDGIYDFAFSWYQDEDVVYLVDGVRKKYDQETLDAMYRYLNGKGELYFIERMIEGQFKPIGDVTFWQEDMPIVIGDAASRGKGMGRKVVNAFIYRAQELGYEMIYVDEIYDFNEGSRKCFESCGFEAYEKTEKGNRFQRELCITKM